MKRHTIFVLALAGSLGACAPLGRETGPVWVPSEKRYISEDEALERMAAAPVLLLGESHDNQEHHRLQARVVAHLSGLGQRRALAFEMIDRDRQASLAGFGTGEGKEAQALRLLLDWDKSGWPDFALYAPIFHEGMKAGWPIIAANLPKSSMKGAGKQGGLSQAQEDQLGLNAPLAQSASDDLKQDLIDSHCGLLPESSLPAMMRIQIARDGAMALSLIENMGESGAVLIAGAGHVRTDRAVPLHIARLKPGLGVLSLAFRERAEPPSPPESGNWPYDLVWFTPPAPEVDHCAGLKKRLEKKKDSP
jgi:uncharacterized iron-regulated protein